MGRAPRSSSGEGLNKGAWATSEDKLLLDYVKIHGEGRWSRLSRETGLKRCGKSCRLRWMNYLRPDIKLGNISADEEDLIIRLHKLLGNRWSLIAGRLPGRTDNEIKNYWNTNIVKKKPKLMLPRLVMLRNTEKIPDPNPRGDVDHLPTQLERPEKVIATAAQQDNEINRASTFGLSTCDNTLAKQITTSYSDNLSDGLLSLVSPSEDNPGDFIGFTMDDICQILEADFTGLEDIDLSNKDSLGIDCFLNESKLASPAGDVGDDMGAREFQETGVVRLHSLDSIFGLEDNNDGK